MLTDAWRLAVGTLTSVPVRAPDQVDRRRAGAAMLLAPIAVVPLALVIMIIAVAGESLGLPALVIALLGIGALALGTRCLHLDGLSDVADGLTASYDKQRSLEVMKTSTSGPAGVVAVVVVLGLQAAGLAGILTDTGLWSGTVLAGLAVCVSRGALMISCLRGIPPARSDGLGRTFTRTVAPVAAIIGWVLAAGALGVTGWWAGLDWWRGIVAAAITLVIIGLLVAHTVRRFGGVTGDVFGAGVELALAALLVTLS